MSSKGGLLGISGLSGDCRDLEEAAAGGHDRAEKALRLFEASIRFYVGAYMALLGGTDIIVFTGGIGENSERIRTNVCRDMEWAGLELCSTRNSGRVRGEARLTTDKQSGSGVGGSDKRRAGRRETNGSRHSGKGLIDVSGQNHGQPRIDSKVDSLIGQKLLLVEPLRVDEKDQKALKPTGRSFVVVDTVGAGEGEVVLCVQGSSARFTPGTKELPIDAAIIGIVDQVQVRTNTIFSSSEAGPQVG